MKDLATIVVIALLILYKLGSSPQIAPAAAGPIPLGAKSVVTATMEVSAHFSDTGGVWCFQAGCQHWGTDYAGLEGTPVYAPFDLQVIALGDYPPGPTWGQYLQGMFSDGTVFYAGHLKERPLFAIGQVLPAGTLIGLTNGYNHTHIQLGRPGDASACAQRGACLDFEVYYASH